jgi:hypothetical protein
LVHRQNSGMIAVCQMEKLSKSRQFFVSSKRPSRLPRSWRDFRLRILDFRLGARRSSSASRSKSSRLAWQ